MTPSQREHAGVDPLGVLMVVFTLAAWSAVPLFIKHFAHLIDPWTSNGWRYGFAALMWAPVVLLGARRGMLPAGLWRAAIVPSVFNAAGQVCFTCAHYMIDPALLTFGLRSQIVFVAAGAYVLFPPERRVIRSAGYVIGAVMVSAGTIGTVVLGDEPLRGAHAGGVALSLAAGFFFAAYGLSVRHFMRGVNPVVAFASISQYTAGAMVVLMLILGRRAGLAALDPAVLSGAQWGLLILSAVIGIALGHVFYYASIARLGVAVSTGVIQLQPFGVAAGSYLLFHEVLNSAQWVSGAVAVSGAVLMLAVQRLIKRVRGADLRPATAAHDATHSSAAGTSAGSAPETS